LLPPLHSFPTRRSSDLLLARDPGLETRIADQILSPDHFQEPTPMCRIGAARIDIDVIVRPSRLAGIDAARHREARQHLRAVALRDRKSTRLNSSHLGIS